jgi:hypothetical protein
MNTRHEMLAATSQIKPKLSPNGCYVSKGLWNDPFSGKQFTRSSDLDVDHIVPLAWAHAHEGREERFTSVIDFPNFLMQVLRICTNTNSGGHRLSLDDKGLIKAFTSYIGNTDNKAERAKKFVYNLLKIRYLFDRYIIKRERVGGKEDWSLKRYKLEKSSSYVNSFDSEDSAANTVSHCVMLLSAFHVSYPTNSGKNWLSAVLYWLNERNENENVVTSEAYTDFLERLARSFMLNRYLTTDPKDYENFIYNLENNDAVCIKNCKDLMGYGRARVFSFNYLDYLLWRNKRLKFEILNKFRFTSNNSTVEHFSPQQPKANEKIPESALHSFGNLCLMANTDNSSLSNDGPKQKANILKFRRDKDTPLSLSLKLELMLEKAEVWGASAIEATDAIIMHEKEMINIILNDLRMPIN